MPPRLGLELGYDLDSLVWNHTKSRLDVLRKYGRRAFYFTSHVHLYKISSTTIYSKKYREFFEISFGTMI